MNRNKCPQFVLNFFRDEKKRSHFGRIWNYARTKVQDMLREFGTFFAIVHPVLFWCTFAHVCRYKRIFVLRTHIIRLGADSICRSKKEMEIVGKNYRLTNSNNKYWKHAEKMGKPEIPKVFQRHRNHDPHVQWNFRRPTNGCIQQEYI